MDSRIQHAGIRAATEGPDPTRHMPGSAKLLSSLLLNAPDAFEAISGKPLDAGAFGVAKDADPISGSSRNGDACRQSRKIHIPLQLSEHLDDYLEAVLLEQLGVRHDDSWKPLVQSLQQELGDLLHRMFHHEDAAVPRRQSGGRQADAFLDEGVAEFATQRFFAQFVEALGIPDPTGELAQIDPARRPFREEASALHVLFASWSNELGRPLDQELLQCIRRGGGNRGIAYILEQVGAKQGLSKTAGRTVLMPELQNKLGEMLAERMPDSAAERRGHRIGERLQVALEAARGADRKSPVVRERTL